MGFFVYLRANFFNMNRIHQIFGLICFLFAVSGCAQKKSVDSAFQKEATNFNADSLLHHVKLLSSDDFEGRRTGTEGADKAKNYIIKQYKMFNVQPLNNSFEQSFSFEGRGSSYQGTNILGYIKGSKNPQHYIVISAHYDHEGIKNGQIYNGADDDASGVSALIAFAEYFQNHPPNYSIILAAFDAEELGLKGSKYYVDNPIVPLESIKMNINMDMIGRNDNNELYVTGAGYNDTLKSVISDFEPKNNIKLLMGHDNLDSLQDWTFSSDHGPFYLKKIPFLYFGVEDHEDYHKPTDDFEKIQPEFYTNAVQTIISIFNKLDTTTL